MDGSFMSLHRIYTLRVYTYTSYIIYVQYIYIYYISHYLQRIKQALPIIAHRPSFRIKINKYEQK